MPDATLAPIPTYADDDLGQSASATPVQFPPSRRRLLLRGRPKENMTLLLNPLSRSEWAVKCATASDDESFVLVLVYLHSSEPTAAEGQAIIDFRTVGALPDGAASEVFTLPPSAEAQRFLDTIRLNISEDSADLVREGGAAPTQATIDTCLAIASNLSTTVASKPSLKYAAFVEESGGISLVLRSGQAGRRANFRISPGGCQVAVVAVTSQGRASTNPARIDDTETLRGWIEWLEKPD